MHIIVRNDTAVLSRATPHGPLVWLDLRLTECTEYRYAITFDRPDAGLREALVERLLDMAFSELQHDTGPQDKEYVHSRGVLSKKFRAALSPQAPAEQPKCARCDGEWHVKLSREETKVVGEEWSDCSECNGTGASPVQQQQADKCEECDGNGRWYDASHGASRRCKACDGTGAAAQKDAVRWQWARANLASAQAALIFSCESATGIDAQIDALSNNE